MSGFLRKSVADSADFRGVVEESVSGALNAKKSRKVNAKRGNDGGELRMQKLKSHLLRT